MMTEEMQAAVRATKKECFGGEYEYTMFVQAIKAFLQYNDEIGSVKAKAIREEYVRLGRAIEWIQPNAAPIWKKHGYPHRLAPTWVDFEKELRREFM